MSQGVLVWGLNQQIPAEWPVHVLALHCWTSESLCNGQSHCTDNRRAWNTALPTKGFQQAMFSASDEQFAHNP